ncbi:MAG: hypothetical protein A2X05_16650 [Bacteroidetes bacterium GWE2_41_25]|nr:MAG: hypothetical protein A2X06_02235 [Bacteroidetes bacterium GWC2_40_22]OFY08651.1 MAG: hypothetical protein A2X05_16650 [Bacteroidetes bacterium GWE2_41_25]OFY60610.1 MAG: hypothetical protein A2X04_08835 [Bacteroidetes bacterium GWF2_41_9]HAM10304.1 hypothetical protein [Bacteroidales bacterium]HBH85119.1 hypothetical protein [Bacteroidales bacterium]
MKKIFIILSLSLFLAPVFAQEESAGPEPVTGTFNTASLIDNHTIASPYKGGIEMQIHHRFSLIENIKNLYGIYGAANTRIGLNYGITDRLMIGAGTTKDYKLQDIQWKYAILQQKADNSMPFSLSYYGNMVIDARADENFGPEASYKFIHRISYFTQLILARKFSEKFSMQVAPSAIYFNSVPEYSDTTGYKNFNLGLSVGGRYNVAGNHSLMFEYDQLLTKQDMADEDHPKPNLSLGWEINTGTHAFQLFVANYSNIINQYNLLYNSNDFADGEFLVGFNITVRF